MPRRRPRKSVADEPTEKEPKRPKIASDGHRLPCTLLQGKILTDMLKRTWRLGNSIGLGGFGEIYLASDSTGRLPARGAKYVIKIEPHSNGPLFSEMHFYYRVGKPEQIEKWKKKKRLKFLGMPKFIGCGSHKCNGVKYRFMVLERFGEDLQKLLEKNNGVFPLKTVYTLGIKILNILEYIHDYGYIHADVKASNLTSGFGKGKENEVHLIDFGLACKYVSHGVHKEFKEDMRKAHDGTMEYTSRDAHLGAHSRRGDLEILGYNMLHWICGYLPWEDNLKDPEYVAHKKNMYMNNIPSLMKQCFPDANVPKGITEYLEYVVHLKFEEKPMYSHCINILKSAIEASGSSYDNNLVYRSKPSSFQFISRKRCAPKSDISPPCKVQKTVPFLRKMASESAGIPSTPCKKVRRVASATPRLQTSKPYQPSIKEYMSTINNPTPAMLVVLQRKLDQLKRQLDFEKIGVPKNGMSKNGIVKDKVVKLKVSVNSENDANNYLSKYKAHATKLPNSSYKAEHPLKKDSALISSARHSQKRTVVSSISAKKVHLQRVVNHFSQAVETRARTVKRKRERAIVEIHKSNRLLHELGSKIR